jgi:Trk K+ transport system NAD-binding subunit
MQIFGYTPRVADGVPKPMVVRRHHRVRAFLLYLLAILNEFRITLAALGAMIAVGAAVFAVTPHQQFDGKRPDLFTSIYAAWMAMLAQPVTAPPQPLRLTLIEATYPVFGFLLIGEGVVRLALLLMSRRHGEKEWMMVMAQTYRDHVVLCGLGHLGFRVFQQLVASHVDVVVVEMDENNRFLSQARTTGACILIRDMKDDQALVDAGVDRARAIIVATNDDMANLEVAMDARHINPRIRILLRLFDQQVAQKIAGALTIDEAFSASALAAPLVAAMSLRTRIMTTTVIAGVPHVISELRVEPNSILAGKRIDEVESAYAARILARTPAGAATQSPPEPASTLLAGDTLIVHAPAAQITAFAAAGLSPTA